MTKMFFAPKFFLHISLFPNTPLDNKLWEEKMSLFGLGQWIPPALWTLRKRAACCVSPQTYRYLSPLKSQTEYIAEFINTKMLLCALQDFLFLQIHLYRLAFIISLWTARWKFRKISFSLLKIFNSLSSHPKPLLLSGANENINPQITY